MRISDWSSDVCSSDLHAIRTRHAPRSGQGRDEEASFLRPCGSIGIIALHERTGDPLPAMALIEAVRIQGVERPPPQSLQIRVVMEITQHGRGKPLALMFFQHIDISEMREVRMISDDRSEASRVGKECVSTCRSGWSPVPSTKKE